MTPYTNQEKRWLIGVALVGAVGLNGAFLYGAMRPDLVVEAMGNPVAVAFILEAFVLVALLAYLMERWRVSRLRWPWLVGLSLLGGLAFAIPVVLLWDTKSEGGGRQDAQSTSTADR